MRYDDDQKQRTHARVLAAAARAIRGHGPDRMAVAGIMAKAGLTHGGFYAHFASKGDLVNEAIGHTFVEARGKFDAITRDRAPGEALSRYIDFYLSAAHRDGRDRGCPVAALSADLPRLSKEARRAFSAGVAGLAAALSAKLETLGHADAAELALSMVSELAGAVALARSVEDIAQSDAILGASGVSLRRRLGLEAVKRSPARSSLASAQSRKGSPPGQRNRAHSKE
jgi:TetR/AcrR family transcriptional repressor of nem operon